MKRVIAFSLWGALPQYVNGAIENAQMLDEFYPGWTCRFYVPDTDEQEERVPDRVISELLSLNCEIVTMQQTAGALRMFWRFHPMFDDPDIERFIVRDTDSKFTQREVQCVNEWIESGKSFHVIRDASVHNIPILGGTWGAIPGCIQDMDQKISWYMSLIARPDFNNPRGAYFGQDQYFLCQAIWPLIINDHLAHVRSGMPQLVFTGKERLLDDPKDGHFVGMPA